MASLCPVIFLVRFSIRAALDRRYLDFQRVQAVHERQWPLKRKDWPGLARFLSYLPSLDDVWLNEARYKVTSALPAGPGVISKRNSLWCKAC